MPGRILSLRHGGGRSDAGSWEAAAGACHRLQQLKCRSLPSRPSTLKPCHPCPFPLPRPEQL